MRTIIGKKNFGIWLKKGKTHRVSNHLAESVVSKGYAEYVPEEETEEGKLLMEYGLEPDNISYSRIKIVEILKLVEEWRKDVRKAKGRSQ